MNIEEMADETALRMADRHTPGPRRLWEWSAKVANDPHPANTVPMVERVPPAETESLTERVRRLAEYRQLLAGGDDDNDEGPEAA